MVQNIFITGIGTGIGKTVISAILAEALQADYWKPVHCGMDGQSDAEWIQSVLTNKESKVYPEAYRLKLPVSPHLAAKEEDRVISLENIFSVFSQHVTPGRRLIIEGTGGLMVPLNDHEMVLDLIMKLNAKVILVSRNYLGSINHSLITAKVCRQKSLRVIGWMFNDKHLVDYENDIVQWSGYPRLASIGKLEDIDANVIKEKAAEIKEQIGHFF